MGDAIRILHLEDSPADAGLIARELKTGKIDCEILVTDTKAKFEKAINDLVPDIILCDNSVPSFDAGNAMSWLKERELAIPLIIVTATMSEEFAVNVMKQGAADYVFKDRLHRLPDAILNTLEKWQLKKAQQESETQREFDMSNMEALINNTKDLMWSVDRNYDLITSNVPFDEVCKVNFGKVLEKGENVLSVAYDPEMLARFKESYGRALAGEEFTETERFTFPSEHWSDISYSPIRKDDEVIGVACSSRDVTHIRMVEKQREFDKNNLDALINNTRDLMWSVDTDLRLIVANRPFDEAIQLYMGRTIAKGESVLLPELPDEIRIGQMECYRLGLEGKESTIVDHLDDPVEIWGEVSYTPIMNNNVVIGIACHSRIITELKMAERLIKKSEMFSRGVLNSLSSHIAVVNGDGTILAVNESWTQFALENGETTLQRSGVGSNYFQVCEQSAKAGDGTAQTAMQGIRDVMEDRETDFYLEYPCHSPDEKRWFGMRVLKFDGDESMVVVSHQDISERKLAEQDLLESAARLKEAQELAKIGHWSFHVVKKEVFWSDSMRSIHGVALDAEATAQASAALLHPDDFNRVKNEIVQAYHAQEEREIIYRIVRPDNGEVRIMRGIIDMELGPQGGWVRMFGIAEDVTELKLAEQERDTTLRELEQRVADRTRDLTSKNKDILDSIIYAKRIQSGLLSPESDLTQIFPESFILACPRDIVSGDFFWVHERDDRKYIVVADCTGHGVPGALMSIIGNNLLDQVIIEERFNNPSTILEQLDKRLKVALKSDQGVVQDGMDLMLCVIDGAYNELYFAGALRPLFITDPDGRIHELTPDRVSIGGHGDEERKQFSTKRSTITQKQRMYLTSDGYYSQFGGPDNKKFMKSRFKDLLETIQPSTMDEQRTLLRNALIEWQGNHEQVDDVLVVGIEL